MLLKSHIWKAFPVPTGPAYLWLTFYLPPDPSQFTVHQLFCFSFSTVNSEAPLQLQVSYQLFPAPGKVLPDLMFFQLMYPFTHLKSPYWSPYQSNPTPKANLSNHPAVSSHSVLFFHHCFVSFPENRNHVFLLSIIFPAPRIVSTIWQVHSKYF